MPILRMNVCERPGDTGEVKPTGYRDILVNVPRIIVVNEVVPERPAKNHPCKDYQTNANADDYRAARCVKQSS